MMIKNIAFILITSLFLGWSCSFQDSLSEVEMLEYCDDVKIDTVAVIKDGDTTWWKAQVFNGCVKIEFMYDSVFLEEVLQDSSINLPDTTVTPPDTTNTRLDVTIGSEIATFLYRIKPDYTGHALIVDNGTTTDTIDFINDDLDTVSLMSFAGSGTVTVQRVYDQSGNDNHLEQSVKANQPTIVENGLLFTLNGKPALDFDGSNDYFDVNMGVVLSQPNHYYVTGAFRDISGGRFVGHVNSSNRHNFYTAGTQYAMHAGSQTLNDKATTDANQHLWSCLFHSGNSLMRIDQEQAGVSPGGQSLASNFLIGGSGSGRDDIIFQGFLLFNEDHRDKDLEVEKEINNYYNIFTYDGMYPVTITDSVTMIISIGESIAGYGTANTNDDATPTELAPRPYFDIWDNVNMDGFEDFDIGTNNLLKHDGAHLFEDNRHNYFNGIANHFDSIQVVAYGIKSGQGGAKTSDYERTGEYWNRFIWRINAARQKLLNQGLYPKIYVVVSIGVNDANGNTPYNQWHDDTKLLIEDIYAHTDIHKIFITELPNPTVTTNRTALNGKIDDIVSSLSYLYKIDTDSASMNANDNNHFNYEGNHYIADEIISKL